MSVPLSQSNGVFYTSLFFGTVPIGLGLNAIFRPAAALSLFELRYPTAIEHRKTVDTLMMIYGARNLFMASTILITTFTGTKKALGCIFIGTGALAFLDGVAALTQVGKGQWGHWTWTPILAGFGVVVLGALD